MFASEIDDQGARSPTAVDAERRRRARRLRELRFGHTPTRDGAPTDGTDAEAGSATPGERPTD